MSHITIYSWTASPEGGNCLEYPATAVTRLTSPGAVLMPPTTRFIVITCDADTRMSFDGSAVAAGDMPVMSSVPNQFSITSPPLGVTLTFA